MASRRRTLGPDQPVAVSSELLHATERTRVTRVVFVTGSVIRKEPLGPEAQQRLAHEVEILERLSGLEGVAQLAEGAPPFPGSVLLADVGGTALSERTTPLDPGDLVDLAESLARAVAGMHQRGVVHRNINPANIVVSRNRNAPYVIDFALATSFTTVQEGFVHYSAVVGTLPYVAPEQSGRTGRPVDQRADLYALGATLYELATGAPPFGTNNPLRIIHDHLARVPAAPSEVNQAVPAALSAIIMHLLEKEPDDRYQSAEGLVRDLALVRRGEQVVRPGGQDVPARVLAPSRLAGRDQEIGALEAAFVDATEGRSSGLLVGGAPGVGKTSLVNELRRTVAGHDGWFVAGKFDQYRRDPEYDAVRQALRALARRLLAEPEDDLAEIRDRMLRALGPNAGLEVAALPELGALLSVPPEPGDPMTAQLRLHHAAVAVLRAVASSKRPVVFFVDDLQWAWRTPLDFLDLILSGDEQVEGLLLVGAYREGDVEVTHRLTPMLARWRSQPDGPRHIRLGNLTPDHQAVMVADLLHLAPAPATELARLIAPATGGNPYNTVELLGTLRHDGVLVASDGEWRWDRATLRRRLDRVDMRKLLATHVATLAPGTRDILAVMACLAGRVELDLLATATQLPADELDRRLAPAFADGLLVLEPDDRPSVRFHHDRARESLLAALTAGERRGMHLRLARRLAHRPEFFAVAAEQYLHVADAVHTTAERRLVAGLFRHAADEASAGGNYALTERLAAAAVPLTNATDTEELIAVRTEWHAALCRLGRFEEADEEYEAISRLCAEAEQATSAIVMQIISLIDRNRPGDAMRLGLDHLRKLGIAVPPREDLGAEIERTLDELYRWIDETDESDDLGRPVSYDRRQIDSILVINRLVPAAFFSGDSEMMAWLTVKTLQIWARSGPAPNMLASAAHIAVVTISRRHDYRTGYRMMRRIVAVGQKRRYEPDLPQAQFLYALTTGHWFDTLEDNVSVARRALEGLIQIGYLHGACWTHYTMMCNLLDCAPSLDVFVAEVDDALKMAARSGNVHAAETFRTYRQVARVLQGEADESAVDQAALENALADNPHAAASLHVTRAVIAAVLDHPDELARHAAAVSPFAATIGAGYATAVTRVLLGVALAGRARRAVDRDERGPILAELDETVAWLSERATDAPVNFLHLLRLLEAERAWAAGDFREAAYAFDEAQRESFARTRPWHRAMIMERAARFYLSHGMRVAGRRLLAAARREYLNWGAAMKVSLLDWADPTLRDEPAGAVPDARSPAAPAVRSTVATGTIDLLGIVAASQALSSETDIDRLRARVVGILSEMTGATAVHLLIRDRVEHDWLAPADALALREASRRPPLPWALIRYVERTRETANISDATRDERFRHDPYFMDLDRCALLAIPIMIRREMRAMLLLENRMIRGAFSTENLEGIMLIAGQLAVSVDNALVHASLEHKVAERTRQLAAANQRLEQLSITDPLTGMANRRRLDEVLEAEWQRAEHQEAPIALAMIDIDHFKRYNDHFGHTAGDRCLQRVATCLTENIGDTHLAARYGGEEFAIVMPDTDTGAAGRLGQLLCAAVIELAEPHPTVREHLVTVSIGVAAVTPTAGDRVTRLVDLADGALYRAKRDGRNRVEVETACSRPAR
jgi:diguanylate cyclase (GGDEF)-like protein